MIINVQNFNDPNSGHAYVFKGNDPNDSSKMILTDPATGTEKSMYKANALILSVVSVQKKYSPTSSGDEPPSSGDEPTSSGDEPTSTGDGVPE